MMFKKGARGAGVGVVLFFGLACAGMASDVQGTAVMIDGTPWAVDICESGAVHNFDGIELRGMDGRRLRIQTKSDGKANIFLLEQGADVGKDLGTCGTGAFHTTGLTINSIVALAGEATIACEGEVAVQGTIKVDRCATPLF